MTDPHIARETVTNYWLAQNVGPSGCRIYKADRWKPTHRDAAGKTFHFTVFNYGHGYYVARLFDTPEERRYYERRVAKWAKLRPHCAGTIRWKEQQTLAAMGRRFQ